MANVTIAVDDELLRQARVKAVQQGTSVNEICRQAIERFALDAQGDAAARIAKLRAFAQKVPARPVGDTSSPWAGRDALYEEALRERGLLRDEPARPARPRG